MANTDYLSKLPIFVAGTALEEVQSVEVNKETNLQKIVTMLKGLAGFSSGAKEVNISVTCAVPIGGPEFDFWNTAEDEEWVDIQIGLADKDFCSTGKITKVSFQGATDKAVELRFDWVGKSGRLE